MAKSDKTPKHKEVPPPRSPRVKATEFEDTNKSHPVWSILHFDHKGPWGRDLCDEDSLWEELLPKLRNYETMTWNDIQSNKKRDHSVSVQNLIKEAQVRLQELKLDDYESLFRFRLSGEKRVWGIREGRVFYLLWWDPHHAICPSTLN